MKNNWQKKSNRIQTRKEIQERRRVYTSLSKFEIIPFLSRVIWKCHGIRFTGDEKFLENYYRWLNKKNNQIWMNPDLKKIYKMKLKEDDLLEWKVYHIKKEEKEPEY
jgi:hypothetical protein